ICAWWPSSASALVSTLVLVDVFARVKKTRLACQSIYQPCQVPERSCLTPAMSWSSYLEPGNLGRLLHLLLFGLPPSCFQAVFEVRLHHVDTPHMPPKESHRWRDVAPLHGARHRVVRHVKQGFQVLGGQQPKESQWPGGGQRALRWHSSLVRRYCCAHRGLRAQLGNAAARSCLSRLRIILTPRRLCSRTRAGCGSPRPPCLGGVPGLSSSWSPHPTHAPRETPPPAGGARSDGVLHAPRSCRASSTCSRDRTSGSYSGA